MKPFSSIKSIEDLREAISENRSPMRAIKLKCLDCSVYQPSEVTRCEITDCPLLPFRMGRNPFVRRKEMTEEERAVARERMLRMNERRKGGSSPKTPHERFVGKGRHTVVVLTSHGGLKPDLSLTTWDRKKGEMHIQYN